MGVAAWWYNWHSLKTAGEYSIKLTLLGPLGLFGGILFLWRPEWTGPIRNSSTRAHKTALAVVIALVALTAAVDFYFLQHYQP